MASAYCLPSWSPIVLNNTHSAADCDDPLALSTFLGPITSLSCACNLDSDCTSSIARSSTLYTSLSSFSSSCQSSITASNASLCDYLDLNKPLPALPNSPTVLNVVSLLDSLYLIDQQMVQEIKRVKKGIEETRQLVETCRRERRLQDFTNDADSRRDEFWLLA